MLTMHPSIMLGSYILDRDRLPEDEFRLRMEDVQARMDAAGLGALLVYGDARQHGALAWLSNFIPRMRWGMALLARHGAPRLLCSMSSRDIPAMRTMTWIEDVRSGWEWKWFDDWAATQPPAATSRIGTMGFALMPAAMQRAVRRSLGDGAELVPVDEFVAAKDQVKRPRELAMVRQAAAIAQQAAGAFATAWRETGDPERAALAAETHARRLAVQDVRTLVSFDGGRMLEPYRGRFDLPTGALIGYVAVKLAGYWGEAFVTVAAPERQAGAVRRGLDRLVAVARPGTDGAALRDAVTDALGNASLHPVLSGQLAHGIGLSAEEGPGFDAGETMVADGVYTLQFGIADAESGALASAMVRVTADGAELLCRSVPEPKDA